MPGPPHVLQLDTATEWRGGQVQTLALLHGMVRAGWRVTLACPRAGALWARAEGLCPRIHVPAGRSPRTIAAVHATDADLVAAQTSHAHTLAALCRALEHRPLVVHRRVDFVPGGGWKYARPDAYVAVSDAVAAILRGVGARRVFVVPDGVDALPPAPPAPDGPAVLAVGARVAHKGHAVLAAAAGLLRAGGVDVDIGVAGDGPLVFDGLRWLGRREDVPALLAAARVFVHPSVEEGMGQAVIEAMLAGLPVVCSDAGGLPEVVGATAIVVPRGDPAALAEGIRRALAGDHPPVEAARIRARERFSVDAMVQGTLDAYRAVLEGDPAVARPAGDG